MKRESFIFYQSFSDAISELDDACRLAVYDAIVQYGLTGEMPEMSGVPKAIMTLIRPQIDANLRRYENGRKGAEHGKKGGRPRENTGESNPTETPKKPQENPTETPNVNVNDNVKESNTSNEVSLKKAGDNSSPESPAEISNNQISALNDEKTSAQNTPPPTPSPQADGQGVPPRADPQSGISAHIAEQFGKFWDMYGKKTSPKNKCLLKWKRLSVADREAIFRTLPEYVKSTPEKQYRKNPETYLNQRTWEMEIIPRANTHKTEVQDNVPERRSYLSKKF